MGFGDEREGIQGDPDKVRGIRESYRKPLETI